MIRFLKRRTPAEETRMVKAYAERDKHRANAARILGEDAVYRLHSVANDARSHGVAQQLDRQTARERADALFVADRLEEALNRAEPARHASRDNVTDKGTWRRVSALLEEARCLVREHADVASVLLAANAQGGVPKSEAGRPSARRIFLEAAIRAHPAVGRASPAAWAHLSIAVGLDLPGDDDDFENLKKTFRDLLNGRKRRGRGKPRRP